jgi:hypothetical protein
MMTKTAVLLVLVAVLVTAIVACGGSAPTSLKVGDLAPSFALPDVNGKTVTPSDYRDKQPMLFYFSMADG